MARRQPPRHVGPVAADHDRHPRLLQALGQVDGVLDVGVLAVERRVCASLGEHGADHPQPIRQRSKALARLGESVPIGQPLVPLPAGTDTELHAAAGDDVHGGDHLRHQGLVTVAVADDDVPQPDAGCDGCQRGQRRERFEGQLIGRLGQSAGEILIDQDALIYRSGADTIRIDNEQHVVGVGDSAHTSNEVLIRAL